MRRLSAVARSAKADTKSFGWQANDRDTTFRSDFPPPPIFLHDSIDCESGFSRTVQQPNRRIQRCGTEVHVPLRRLEVLMSGEFLDRSPGAPRIARCEQNVWRRMWTPGFTFARLATRRIITWMTFCGCPCLSQRTRSVGANSKVMLPFG